MKDDGFLLMDSLITLKIVLLIVTFLIPTIVYMSHIDQQSTTKLKFFRELYVETNIHEDFETLFKKGDYYLNGDEICKTKSNQCYKIK